MPTKPRDNDSISGVSVSSGAEDDIGTTAPLTDALAPFFEIISKDGKEINIAEVILNNGRSNTTTIQDVGADIVDSITRLTEEVAKLTAEVRKVRKEPVQAKK